jgi:hypothetical protein
MYTMYSYNLKLTPGSGPLTQPIRHPLPPPTPMWSCVSTGIRSDRRFPLDVGRAHASVKGLGMRGWGQGIR